MESRKRKERKTEGIDERKEKWIAFWVEKKKEKKRKYKKGNKAKEALVTFGLISPLKYKMERILKYHTVYVKYNLK